MARYEFKLPDIGEGIAEAEIVAWHVKIGDEIGEDQQIADMMTDKATVEMESPVAGKVIALRQPIAEVLKRAGIRERADHQPPQHAPCLDGRRLARLSLIHIKLQSHWPGYER